jgi:hypothetical protein
MFSIENLYGEAFFYSERSFINFSNKFPDSLSENTIRLFRIAVIILWDILSPPNNSSFSFSQKVFVNTSFDI